VVSVKVKASLKGSGKDQGDERKRTIDEVSKSEDVVKTGDSSRSSGRARRRPAYSPGGNWHKDGMNLIQGFVWFQVSFVSPFSEIIIPENRLLFIP